MACCSAGGVPPACRNGGGSADDFENSLTSLASIIELSLPVPGLL